jgi:hypothetical protein
MKTNRLPIYESALKAYDILVGMGVEFAEAYKRRDPKEPGRVIKTQFEDDLFKLTMRYFRRCKKRAREYVENTYPARKADFLTLTIDQISEDERFQSELFLWLIAATDAGIELSEELIGIGLSGAVNTEAAKWAREHAGELIEQLTDFQREAIQDAIAAFVETPGMTIGDVINDLIGDKLFSEKRAIKIAVTETTDAFSQADKIAGEALQEQFPDVLVTKTWWTNNDSRVCPICGPLHGQEVPINENFHNDELDLEFEGPSAHPHGRCWRSTRTRINA